MSRDRPIGVPSVEAVKECLYNDHAMADQLTGAFKILREVDGCVRVVFQARNQAAAGSGEVCLGLQSQLRAHWPGEVLVEVMSPQAFPWRPLLDHERKFAYLDASVM